jgi:hypothetical protein
MLPQSNVLTLEMLYPVEQHRAVSTRVATHLPVATDCAVVHVKSGFYQRAAQTHLVAFGCLEVFLPHITTARDIGLDRLHI